MNAREALILDVAKRIFAAQYGAETEDNIADDEACAAFAIATAEVFADAWAVRQAKIARAAERASTPKKKGAK